MERGRRRTVSAEWALDGQENCKVRVLVVEDDSIAADLLEHALVEFGWQVTRASNGLDALDCLRDGGFRLMVSDWEMPQLTGIELCRRVRESYVGQYIYIILLTSRSGRENVIEGLSAGADEFISKPFDAQELYVRLRVAQRILSLESREMTIFSLAKLAESRDPETGVHLERIREYCRVLALQLSTQSTHAEHMGDEYVQLIYLTSPLHDIGKVGIPDAVLLKPGPLTAEEFKVMKTHAEIGARTLSALVDANPDAKYLRMARDIAWTHHEKFDGTGYPRGLVGEQIPLCGRIVAVADVYDALTTRRVYKPAFSHEKARSIIVEGSGTHFDPDVVQAFLAAETKILRINQRLRDAPPDFVGVPDTLMPMLPAL
jgi:putative two-component system response regulator